MAAAAAVDAAEQQALAKPEVVIGLQYCSSLPVDLTIISKKPALSICDGDFAVIDVDGHVLFKVKGKVCSLLERLVLLDAAGDPMLSMQQKIPSMHKRWQVYRGKSSNPNDLMFSVKQSSILIQQSKLTELKVYLPENTKEDVCDFKVKGNYPHRSCTIYLGDSDILTVAQMSREYKSKKNIVLGKETFGVIVYPNADCAFVVALIVILEDIYKEKYI